MPSIAASSPAITSAPVSSVLSPIAAPMRSIAVPQIGPEVPPTRLVITTATRLTNVPGSVRSKSSQPSSTFSKPRASE